MSNDLNGEEMNYLKRLDLEKCLTAADLTPLTWGNGFQWECEFSIGDFGM